MDNTNNYSYSPWWNKQKAMWMIIYYFPSTVHIKQIHGKWCASDVALPITHLCIPKLIIFINVTSYIQGDQTIAWF